MASKLARCTLPGSLTAEDFTYRGRPSAGHDDFGGDVGIADLKCVKQFGGDNAYKYYHAGVVQSKDGRWFTYFEWGRVRDSRAWDGGGEPQDYQFAEYPTEEGARKAFASQCRSKSTSRLTQENGLWVSKAGKDGYIVVDLATRTSGLPDAYRIKSTNGLTPAVTAPKAKKAKASSVTTSDYHPEEVRLAADLLGGTKSYVARAAAATGVMPTAAAIRVVKDDLITRAMQRIADLGAALPKVKNEPQNLHESRLETACLRDLTMQQISNLVAASVPRPDPGRNASAEARARAIMLTSANIIQLGQDLDAMESALAQEDWSTEGTVADPRLDVDSRLNATIRWIAPTSDLGKWLAATYTGMTNNRHGHLAGQKLKIKGMWSVDRPRVDSRFEAAALSVAQKRKGKFSTFANLQPTTRPDLGSFSKLAKEANVFFGIHGTKPAFVGPILQDDFKLPHSLPGAQCNGAAYGYGVYFATDYRKSHGYTGHGNSYYGAGGQIRGRGFFMFLCDVIMGEAHMANSCGSWNQPPNGMDSIAAYPHRAHVVNDEHIVFGSNSKEKYSDRQRIRYIIEGDFQ